MSKLLPMMLCILMLIQPVSAAELSAPEVPEAGADWMPEQTEDFSHALLEMLEKAFSQIRPDLREAARISAGVFAAALLVCVLTSVGIAGCSGLDVAGVVVTASILFRGTGALIHLADETVQSLSSYSKLLLPVMTGAMAAQGGVSTSAGLYLGTAFFDALLGSLLSGLFIPLTYLYLGLSVAHRATGTDLLASLRDMIRNGTHWCLKTVLTVFTTYMSITGAVSGTTDAAALKATKVAVSTVVPLVGGILADASESVLVGIRMMKNTAGIYGILATLALFLGPFLKIGAHYLILKATFLLVGVFGNKSVTGMIGDFTSAMGMLLAITGGMCLLMLISMVCFMKGVMG